MTDYHVFVDGKYVRTVTSMVHAREIALNKIMYSMKKATICSDRNGKNVLEYMRCRSSDIRGPIVKPIEARKKGSDKWRGVTADGTIF